MSIRVVLSCNGREGVYPCRQAIPVGEVVTAAEARSIAKKEADWTSQLVAKAGESYHVLDYCPSCTRKVAGA